MGLYGLLRGWMRNRTYMLGRHSKPGRKRNRLRRPLRGVRGLSRVHPVDRRTMRGRALRAGRDAAGLHRSCILLGNEDLQRRLLLLFPGLLQQLLELGLGLRVGVLRQRLRRRLLRDRRLSLPDLPGSGPAPEHPKKHRRLHIVKTALDERLE